MRNDQANTNNNYSKKALVIAVSDYDNSSGLKSIEFCKNDGQEMYNVLKKNGYDIPDNRKLIGHVGSENLRNSICDFFMDENNKPDDTLVFYYSGHGVPDVFGGTYLAPSDINSVNPFKAGFSFDDLTKSMLSSNSQSIVTILDSCFSGALQISKSKGLDKSGEEAATILANNILEEKSEVLKQGIGRCLLAASQGYEEAYDRQEKDHSIFTYYLLEGLKGNKDAVDNEGNVTYDTLGKFITREIKKLPNEKRPKQTPVRKGEIAGGEIVLVNYPNLRKTNESDKFTLIGRGESYYQSGKFNTALEYYEMILKNWPNDESALLRKDQILSIIKKLATNNVIRTLPKFPEDYWKNLVARINEKMCIPLIGDSTIDFFNKVDDDNFLTLEEISFQWAAKYDIPFEESNLLPKIAEILAIKECNETYPKQTLSNILRQVRLPDFSLEKFKNSPHVILAQLDLPTYITTNYDLLMEEALRSQGKEPISEICKWNGDLVQLTKRGEIPSVLDEHFQYRPTTVKPLVYHLYGSIDYPVSMVLTEQDFQGFIMNMNKEYERNILPAFVRTGLSLSTLLFIGYSWNDIKFHSILQAFRFFANTALSRNNIIQLPFRGNDTEEKVLKQLEKYTTNAFRLNVYWGIVDDFLIELNNLRKTFKDF